MPIHDSSCLGRRDVLGFTHCRNGDVHHVFLLRGSFYACSFPLCLGLGRSAPLFPVSFERHGRRRSSYSLFCVETGSLFELEMCVAGFQKNWREAGQETDFLTVPFPGSKLRVTGFVS